MTNDRIIFITLIAMIAISVIVALKWRQKAVAKRYIEQIQADNLKRQNFLMARLDAIGKLLGDTSISPSDFEQKTSVLISEMESQNIDGDIGPLIEDTRQEVSNEIIKRKSV
jgi:hypothetical protein